MDYYNSLLDHVNTFAAPVDSDFLDAKDAVFVECSPVAGDEWLMYSYDNDLSLEGKVTFHIDANGHISGSAGCNRYVSGIHKEIDENGNEIFSSDGHFATTMMYCEDEMQNEQLFLQYLKTCLSGVDDLGENITFSITIEGDTMKIISSNGHSLVFHKKPA